MPDVQQIDRLLAAELASQGKKIVVLDDDPTGVQTVHAVSVYTSWDEEAWKQPLPKKSGFSSS
jgi:hypothetical protein